MVQHSVQVKRFADFPGTETEQLVPRRPPAQQICVRTTHLPGTGPAKNEVATVFLHKVLNFIKQLWDFLDFIHNDKLTGRQRTAFLPKAFRLPLISHLLLGSQEIDTVGLRKLTFQQRGFSRLPRPPQKRGRRLRNLQKACNFIHKEPICM
jgi:hypothetical protein